MKRSKIKNAKSKGGAIAISRNFQLVFVGVVISSWFMGNIAMVINMLLADSSMAGPVWRWLGVQTAFPVVLLAVGYAFGNYATTLQQLFNATLRALIGLGIFGFLTTLQYQILVTAFTRSGSTPPTWLISDWDQAVVMLVTVCLYAAGQYWWAHRARRK